MKLTVGKMVAKQMLNAKLTVVEEHPVLTAECTDYYAWTHKIEACQSLEEITDLIKPKYKLKYMQLLMESEYIMHKDVGNLIIYCWDYISTLAYNLYFTKEMFLRFIVNSDSQNFMTPSDMEILRQLPDEIVVYRGATNGSKMGMCWTLDREIAEKYAEKYSANVYQASIRKHYVIAYMEQDKTIILPYRRLENLHLA